MKDSRSGPGEPDIRSAGRYLWWLAASQPWRVAAGALYSSVWLGALTMMPYILSRAVDDGLRPGDTAALVWWALAFLVVGAVNAVLGAYRHRTMTKVRMDATFRTTRVVVRQAVRLGAELPRQTATGEVVTIGVSDVQRMSQTLTFSGPGFGALVAYLLVAGQLLRISPLLAVLVLLGVPALAGLIGPLLQRVQRAEAGYRERQGEVTARFEDLSGGLRVLNGLGGKEEFAARYRRDSARLMESGLQVGRSASWIEALGSGLPLLFLGAVTWVAARMAAQGSITVGELVAVYGYTAALTVPVYFLIEGGRDLTRGLVAAGRTVGFLRLEPRPAGPDTPAPAPASPAPLRDEASGVELTPGRLTVLAAARPTEVLAVADRLALFAAPDEQGGRWDGRPLEEYALREVRGRVLLAENEAALFAGPLREVLAGRRSGAGSGPGADRGTGTAAGPADGELLAALEAASALDVLRGLPGGLDAPIRSEGRNLSGGQRQRLRLARALLAEPEVLIAVEPSSAVDTHTEAAMAAGLRAFRAGRTTLVVSTSPLLLDLADTVLHLVDGQVAATGTHRELLRTDPGYRALVARDEEDDTPASAPAPAPVPHAREAEAEAEAEAEPEATALTAGTAEEAAR
ncbi:ABC transporter transmembrane domain-containing protein [Kitasatospora sp. NPDC096147]|uniref:ABC transporter transmembrane domain-containing protein n=1 Tax=Kitasatospora sp. NPDC096147 TaxID=3364093 RepID=UPI00380BB006